MTLETFALTALAVTVGFVSRDFLMAGLTTYIQKRVAKKKVSQLDAYYQALLDAEAATNTDATSEA